jgi:hypothetical protein
MKKTSMKLAAIAMFVCGSIATYAQGINVVTTAVPFLRITPDARSAGMGELGIAISPDANSGFWNIAKTTFASGKMQLGATYTPWLSDLKLNDVYLINASGYYKLDELQAVSAGIRYFSLGNIQFTDANGNNLNNFRPREFSIEGGYARKLSNKMGLGVALRYISSDLAGGTVNGVSYKKGTSIAGDIHYYYKGTNASGNGFDFGATLSNLGSKISYTNDAKQKDYIPANLGVGAVYNKVFDADNKIMFGVDLNKLLVPTPPQAVADNAASQTQIDDYRSQGVVSSWFSSLADGDDIKEISISAGAEYWYKEQFAFRVGYFGENKLKGDRRYITMGTGIKYNDMGINFAYLLPTGSGVTRNPLSNTLRFSILYDMK